MAISVELSHQLRQLASSLDLDPDSLHDALAGLVSYVQQAVPSYCGLQLTLFDHGWPVTLTQLTDTDDRPATTSLKVSLHALTGRPDSDGGQLLFCATTPGAFVDLAADLSYALGVPVASDPGPSFVEQGDGSATPPAADSAPIVLDSGTIPAGSVSGLSGLAELSVINQAVGTLIDRGHLPEDAHDVIRGGAAAAGVAPHLFAARLLRTEDDDGFTHGR